MTTRPHLVALTVVAFGLVAACAVVSYASGSSMTSLGILIVPLGILVLGGVAMVLVGPHIASPFARMFLGLFVGVAVAEGAALALIRPSPGSIAVIVYGVIGVAVGTALGLASVAMGPHERVRT